MIKLSKMHKTYNFLKTHSRYIYPTLLFCALLIFTLLKISGTSIGSYNDIFYGDESKDSSLIQGEPRQIRSDEWLVITQTIIAQKEAGFPRVNHNFNNGQDMSLISDAPYLEWSAIFKPQNFSFFLMPLENAFAFKWCFLFLLLALAAYYLSLKLVPGKVAFAVAVSLIAACSPFIFWWYQSTTILTFAYGLFILLLGINLIDKSPLSLFRKKLSVRTATLVRTAALSYVLIAFALLLYPPFQIPIALVTGFFLFGYLINASRGRGKSKKYILSLIIPFLCAVAVTGTVCATFIATRADVVHTISNTAYPGKRSVPSGGYNINSLLVTYLQPQIVNDNNQDDYYSNQSEVSNFLLLPLFFVIPLFYALAHIYIKKKQVDWIIVGLLTSTLLLLAHLFIPFASPLLKVFFLNLVPIERAIIGLGFVAIIIIIYLTRLYSSDIKLTRKTTWGVIIYSLLFLGISIASGLYVRELYPELIVSRKILILYALIVYSSMLLILINKGRIGAIVIALFSIYSVYQIHPLYQGLGPIYHSNVSAAIKEISKPDDVWGVAEDMRFENLPQISNRKAVTGVAFYPDLKFWGKHSESNDQSIYNRYAHIVLDKKTTQPILLVQKDVFVVSTSCNRSLVDQLDFILSTSVIEDSCLKLEKKISYPEETFFIYRVSHLD